MKKQTSSAAGKRFPGHSAFIAPDFFIREATLDDAAIIWQTIYDNRAYLRTWLPFVDALKDVADEEAFLSQQLSAPYDERNLVFVIGQGHELCGLVGFVTTDNLNHRTEIGYWLIPEYQGRGVMTRCVRHLCQWAVRERGINSIRIRFVNVVWLCGMLLHVCDRLVVYRENAVLAACLDRHVGNRKPVVHA